IAVGLDDDVLTAGGVVAIERLPDHFDRRRLVELRDHLGAARELEPEGHAPGHADHDTGDDDHPREDDRVPAPPEKVERGVVKDVHLRRPRWKASRPAAGGPGPFRTASSTRTSR